MCFIFLSFLPAHPKALKRYSYWIVPLRLMSSAIIPEVLQKDMNYVCTVTDCPCKKIVSLQKNWCYKAVDSCVQLFKTKPKPNALKKLLPFSLFCFFLKCILSCCRQILLAQTHRNLSAIVRENINILWKFPREKIKINKESRKEILTAFDAASSSRVSLISSPTARCIVLM